MHEKRREQCEEYKDDLKEAVGASVEEQAQEIEQEWELNKADMWDRGFVDYSQNMELTTYTGHQYTPETQEWV